MVINLQAIRLDGSHCSPPASVGESFRLRQCQKTPAVQESHSEDAVEALDKWILPRAS